MCVLGRTASDVHGSKQLGLIVEIVWASDVDFRLHRLYRDGVRQPSGPCSAQPGVVISPTPESKQFKRNRAERKQERFDEEDQMQTQQGFCVRFFFFWGGAGVGVPSACVPKIGRQAAHRPITTAAATDCPNTHPPLPRPFFWGLELCSLKKRMIKEKKRAVLFEFPRKHFFGTTKMRKNKVEK